MSFETVADVLHHLINLVPWREEAHALSAHEVIDRELGSARGAGSTDTSTPRSPDASRSGEGSKATASPSAPDGGSK